MQPIKPAAASVRDYRGPKSREVEFFKAFIDEHKGKHSVLTKLQELLLCHTEKLPSEAIIKEHFSSRGVNVDQNFFTHLQTVVKRNVFDKLIFLPIKIADSRSAQYLQTIVAQALEEGKATLFQAHPVSTKTDEAREESSSGSSDTLTIISSSSGAAEVSSSRTSSGFYASRTSSGVLSAGPSPTLSSASVPICVPFKTEITARNADLLNPLDAISEETVDAIRIAVNTMLAQRATSGSAGDIFIKKNPEQNLSHSVMLRCHRTSGEIEVFVKPNVKASLDSEKLKDRYNPDGKEHSHELRVTSGSTKVVKGVGVHLIFTSAGGLKTMENIVTVSRHVLRAPVGMDWPANYKAQTLTDVAKDLGGLHRCEFHDGTNPRVFYWQPYEGRTIDLIAPAKLEALTPLNRAQIASSALRHVLDILSPDGEIPFDMKDANTALKFKDEVVSARVLDYTQRGVSYLCVSANVEAKKAAFVSHWDSLAAYKAKSLSSPQAQSVLKQFIFELVHLLFQIQNPRLQRLKEATEFENMPATKAEFLAIGAYKTSGDRHVPFFNLLADIIYPENPAAPIDLVNIFGKIRAEFVAQGVMLEQCAELGLTDEFFGELNTAVRDVLARHSQALAAV